MNTEHSGLGAKGLPALYFRFLSTSLFFFFLQCFVIPHMMSDAGVAGMIKYKDFL